MKKLFLIIAAMTLLMLAQAKDGIRFEKGLSWAQIKAKAKAENKFIFVDCYATWCKPCKQMDKSIYPNDSVGALMNDKYVSVKVQIDSSKNDDEEIKSWYGIGHSFIEDYNIVGFPTFLFFSPDGEIVHKDLGSKSVREFLIMANNALEEKSQNYTLIRKYKSGTLDYPSMKNLSRVVEDMGDDQLSLKMARDYMHGYLEKLPLREYATKDNINFLHSNYRMLSTEDRLFDLYYNNPELIDSVMGKKGVAKAYADYLVFRELISPKLDVAKATNKNPDWKGISKQISKKYSKVNAFDMITKAKASWYKYKKDWRNYCKLLIIQVQNTGLENYPADLGGIMALNGNAWDIFLYSNDKNELEQALTWANRTIELDPKPSPAVMDTKANLLYKLGRTEEALALYKEVMKLEPGFKSTFDKMQKGLPTWTETK